MTGEACEGAGIEGLQLCIRSWVLGVYAASPPLVQHRRSTSFSHSPVEVEVTHVFGRFLRGTHLLVVEDDPPVWHRDTHSHTQTIQGLVQVVFCEYSRTCPRTWIHIQGDLICKNLPFILKRQAHPTNFYIRSKSALNSRQLLSAAAIIKLVRQCPLLTYCQKVVVFLMQLLIFFLLVCELRVT